jgi:hypothetical protein
MKEANRASVILKRFRKIPHPNNQTQEDSTMLKDFTKEKFDIIIQAGQSNADGTGFGNTDEPWNPDERVWFMNGDGTLALGAEKVNGNAIQSNFALPFAREYLRAGRLAEGRKILILRTAVGGTGFLDNHWKLTDDLYLRMMEMIRASLALNPENRLVALIWHQGETDAIYHATFDQHYNHLTTLLTSVRDTFGTPALPFIAGDFVQHWIGKNSEICAPVLDAIRAVCRDLAACGFVETDGLKSNDQEFGNGDDIHFSRRSLYELGKRYFEAFAEIAK